MKKLNFLLVLSFALLSLSCKDEPVISPREPVMGPGPEVFAGPDIFMVLPTNSSLLKGSAQYPGRAKASLWKRISGPASFVIEQPSSFETTVRSLEKGLYLFELSMTDNAGLTGKDTVSVTVLEEGTGKNEIIFKDRRWGCPMGCHIYIENFDAIVPSLMAFKVYLKRDHSTEWVEVVNASQAWSKYMWTIYNQGLEILEDQTENPEDTPDVKIVF